MQSLRHANVVLVLSLAAGLCGGAAAMSGSSKAEPVQTPKVSAPKVSAPKVTAPKVAARKVDDRQLRIAIARMFESNRFVLVPLLGALKIHDSKISGPREHTTITGKKTIGYCVSTIIDFPHGSFAKSAGVTVEKLQDGKTQIRMSVAVYAYQECTGPNVEPFPELQRLREARRREMGKTN